MSAVVALSSTRHKTAKDADTKQPRNLINCSYLNIYCVFDVLGLSFKKLTGTETNNLTGTETNNLTLDYLTHKMLSQEEPNGSSHVIAFIS